MSLTTFGILLLVLEIDGSQVITDPPKYTVGCLGGMSNFTCNSNRSDIHGIWWTIDGNGLDNKIKEKRGISIDTVISNEFANSTLTIAGLSINHGIDVGCAVAVSSPFTIKFKSATFNVTEIPPVQNLQMFDSNQRVTVTWSKPSCLPVNYVYLITVDNGAEVTYVANITSEQFSVKVSLCYNYTCAVVVTDANHPQFISSMSTVEKMVEKMVTPERGLSLNVTGYDSHIKFHNRTSAFLNVPFRIINMTCQTHVILVQHVISQLPPNIPLHDDNKEVDVSVDIDTGIGQHSFGPFSQRFKGELTLSIQEDKETKEFSTFNVQKLDVQPHNGRVVITCTFAEGSLADGCAVRLNSTLTVNILKSTDSDTAVHEMTIGDGVYNISAYDIMDGERSGFEAFELNEITFSSVLTTKITSYSTEPEMLKTTSTQASEAYSTMANSPSNIVTSEGSDAKYVLIVPVVAVLALVIVIVLIVGCVMFTIKKYHTKSMEVNVLQEAMFLQKPVAQSPVYTELPIASSLPVMTDHPDEQDDPYFQPRREFLSQSGHSPTPITSSTKSNDSVSLQLALLHETFEQSNPGDTPINAKSASKQNTLSEGYSNPVNTTPSQPGSTVSANSHYADIEFTKQRPRPPLKDGKPLVYASVIQPACNEEGNSQPLQEMPKKETVVAQTGNSAPVFCKSSIPQPPDGTLYLRYDKGFDAGSNYNQLEGDQVFSSDEQSEECFVPYSIKLPEETKDTDRQSFSHDEAVSDDQLMFSEQRCSISEEFHSDISIEDIDGDSEQLDSPCSIYTTGQYCSQGCVEDESLIVDSLISGMEQKHEGDVPTITNEVAEHKEENTSKDCSVSSWCRWWFLVLKM